MMMVVAGTMIGGRAIVMELVVHGMMAGVMISVMIGIMLRGIQCDIREHHVVMIVLADDSMLQVSDNAGGSGLGEHEQQGDTQHRPGLLQRGGPVGSHGNQSIRSCGGVGNKPATPCPGPYRGAVWRLHA